MSDAPSPRGLGPVDWGTARRVARAVAGHDAIAGSYLGSSLAGDFQSLSREAQHLVAAHTRLATDSDVVAAVVDRGQWVDANIASLQLLLEPLTERIGARIGGRALSGLGRHVAGTELGVLLGYVAQRVLGQYDLLVPDEGGPDRGDVVYYVGPNILRLEKRFAFRPRDFRRWIAIHELTHRAQFTGVPWLHEHFLGLVSGLLDTIEPDPRLVLSGLRRAAGQMSSGRNPLDDGGLVGLVATPDQRAKLDEVQALMTLLEGHGNVVMDDLGVGHVHGAERMSKILNSRRQAKGISGIFNKVLGLEMKMRQYAAGERFVREVESAGGPRALDAAWKCPENLPTLAEIDDPATWLERTRVSIGGEQTTSR